MKRSTSLLFFTVFLELLLCAEVFAAKKDFKGLFGSYRRERFTENEGASGELGVDLMLSTLLPMTPLVQSREAVGGSFANLNYSTFFNLEGGLNYSLTYNWLLFLGVGYFNYDTRKVTAASLAVDAARPTFHQFEMTTMPVILGFKYRLNLNDIVPYVGMGAGLSFINQKAFYDSSTQSKSRAFSALTGEVLAGFEFYFAAKAGIRMEAAAYFMKINSEVWDTGAPPDNLPVFQFGGNVWSVRYASGIFFLL